MILQHNALLDQLEMIVSVACVCGGDVCSVSFPHTACINVVSVCSEFHFLFEERGWCQCVHSNAVGKGGGCYVWLIT